MDGIINILKPPGLTSSDVVVDVRRLTGVKRVGHTGTLDPGAAGVLPVCVGKAARLFDYLVNKDKQYLCEICFGSETDTLDAYGALLRQDCRKISQEELERVLPDFHGEQWQVPPMYSALKQDGKKLYQLARKGQELDLEQKRRRIRIDSLKILEQTAENRFLLELNCSKGTYVRSLCRDLAAALDTCAYMFLLIRTRSGNFYIQDAVSIVEAQAAKEAGELEKLLIPMDEAVNFLPQIRAEESQLKKLLNGNSIEERYLEKEETQGPYFRVYCAEEFIGIGTLDEGMLNIKTMLCRTNAGQS